MFTLGSQEPAQVGFLRGTNVNKPFYHVLKPEFSVQGPDLVQGFWMVQVWVLGVPPSGSKKIVPVPRQQCSGNKCKSSQR